MRRASGYRRSDVAAGAVALVACGWFALWVLQASAMRDAQAIIRPVERPAPDRVRDAEAALDLAGLLNPDSAVALERGRLRLDLGDRRGATRLFEDVARREPENVEAWALIAFVAAFADDTATLERARAQMRRLSPPVPDP